MKTSSTSVLLLFAVLFLTGCGQSHPKEIHLAAGAGLKETLNELIVEYKKIAPDVVVIPNYEASGKLQQQIENGAPVDVFISANQDKMNLLEEKKLLIAGTRKNLVKNEIVLIVPKNRETVIQNFDDLGTEKLRNKGLAIGDPKVVPAGQYAVEIFDSLGMTDKVTPKTVLAQNVKAVLTYTVQGEVDAGVVYKTDAITMLDHVVVVAVAPEESHTPAIFPAAVVTTGNNPDSGKEFLKFLFSPEAAVIFQKNGYTMAE
ncbi:MAG: molybdate ABC transporter substrate-binding protein [Planctomycetaceae bacterium]|jgi:molybdate transport system substrate-binding protein|nr:molybdate ABC transporter substrate-binding protein [Planctomycetaceae bacterium]